MSTRTVNDQQTTATRAAQTAASLQRLGLQRDALPRHVAVIMDGNGRWAQQRGLERTLGHKQGAKTVRAIVTEAARFELDVLTLYSFSVENWKRPADEVNFLMALYVEYLKAELPTMLDNNVRFAQIGRRAGLPTEVLRSLDETIDATSHCTGTTLVLAINYGSRAEITDAMRAIARKVEAGELAPDDIDEATISAHLYTAPWPDPDLLIRTAGEMRVSNYLLWQISYAELYVAPMCWPDFDVAAFDDALRAYANRKRKFGAVL